MDLMFPHHECEIAQAKASEGHAIVRYWMHNNMITVEGKKMGKSLGNFITLEQFFTGDHPKLTAAYSPMTIRFFILGAHYRGTVDFSNEALEAARKGYERLLDANAALDTLEAKGQSSFDPALFRKEMDAAMNDDLNTPIVLAQLFEAAKRINRLKSGEDTLTQADLDELKSLFRCYLFDILGMKDERDGGAAATDAYRGAVDLLLEIRSEAKNKKDWTTSDLIRDKLAALGFVLKDTKEGTEWKLQE